MNAPIEYEQTDSRWRNIMYSSIGNGADTIGNSGCGPTCAAMVVATLRDKNVKPPKAASWAVSQGYLSPHDGTYWGFFKPYLASYKIPCIQTDSVSAAIDALKRNYMVITSVGNGIWTSGGHFILAYGIVGNKVKIHDPNSEAGYRELANLSNYRNEAVQFWIIPEAWMVQISNLQVKDLDKNKMVAVSAVNIGGTNYVKLRDLSKLAQVAVSNEGATPTIKADVKGLAVKDLDKGRSVEMAAINVGGSNFVKLRDMSKVAPVAIGNEGATPTVKADVKDLAIKDLDKGQDVEVAAINVGGSNFVKLRDLSKLAPVTIGNEGATPTVKAK